MYKYFSINKYFYNLIIDSELWFSRPSDFNDPFDNNITLECIADDETMRKYFKMKGEDEENIRIKIDQHKRIYRSDNYFQFCEDITKEFHKSIKKKRGICCFSKIPDSILMWSHYADSHKGICLKFDEKLFKLSTKVYKRDVNYPLEKPILNKFTHPEEEILEQSITNKAKCWSYEEEIRLIAPEKNGLIKFGKDALTEVIFGLRTPQNEIERIKKLLKVTGYNIKKK